jgi:hypothetical protein
MAKYLLGLFIALTVIFWMAHAALGAVICGVIAVYFIRLYVYPNRDCISCGGRKSHGPEGSKNFRFCLTCGGRGRYPRLGVRLFRRDVVRGLAEGKRGRLWG